jgi:hypothetical protein
VCRVSASCVDDAVFVLVESLIFCEVLMLSVSVHGSSTQRCACVIDTAVLVHVHVTGGKVCDVEGEGG